jgi:hypothetical protein
MARDLGEVLHHYLPEARGRADAASVAQAEDGRAPSAGAASELVPAPLLCVPIPSHDVVRGALVWNLAVEAARQGAQVALVAPAAGRCAPWPEPGRGPLGVEVTEIDTDQLPELARGAGKAARLAVARGGEVALALAAVPSAWLRKGADARGLLRWVLLLARPDERELLETWAALEAIAVQSPHARIGACVFGVRSLGDARRAFEGLAALAELELSRELVSYGVLIDDVQLSRSIVSQRPIALAQPASAAARALADVASMLIEDVREAAGHRS